MKLLISHFLISYTNFHVWCFSHLFINMLWGNFPVIFLWFCEGKNIQAKPLSEERLCQCTLFFWVHDMFCHGILLFFYIVLKYAFYRAPWYIILYTVIHLHFFMCCLLITKCCGNLPWARRMLESHAITPTHSTAVWVFAGPTCFLHNAPVNISVWGTAPYVQYCP